MPDADLLRRLHRNVMTVSGINGRVPGGRLRDEGGELFYSASGDWPVFNGMFRVPGCAPPAETLDRAEAFFADRGGGFAVYVHPDDGELQAAALARGYAEVLAHYPEMICRAPLDPIAADVRPVETVDDAAAYWAVCDAAYPSIGMPPGSFTAALPPELLLGDGVEACLGWRGGMPVACASVWFAEGIGMIGWVGATPEARGHGLGAAVTVWATNRAFAGGAEVAALQASVMGEPVYLRLGYEPVYSYRLLARAPAG